ncbi:MAG: hypothetical protein CBC48_18715 [bacterium TMED88]|nr:hypothetical protein [Deltaproteobacteria bacterium]OUV23479.1 MAG: hypothetical protein CBC48_18715 [bacterium TMED88]
MGVASHDSWDRFYLRTLILGAAFTLLALMVLPEPVGACTVCMSGQEEESRKAFIGTTAFMTFFPLLMLGVVVGLFIRRTLAQEEEEEAARSHSTVSADARKR